MVDFFRLFGVQKNENAGQADELAHINQEMYKKSVELNERNKTLSLLQKIDEIILSDLTHLNEIAEKVTSLLVTDIDFQLVSLFLHDKQASKLKRIALSQSPGAGGGDAQQEGPAYLLEIPFWATDNLIIQAVNEKVMKFSSGITEVLLSSRSGVSAPEGIQSVFAYPLSVRGEVIGAMVVCMRETQDELSEYRRDLLNRLGELIGIALDNSLLYNEVQASNEKLKTLDKLKDEFVSLASHELRTPMTAIRSYLWMALDGRGGELTEKQKYYLERAYSSTDRLIKLVNDMLNISRIESGRITVNPQPIDLLKLTRDVVEEVAPTAKERGVTVTVTEPEALPEVLADSDKIKEVLFNLLGNSLKFTPKDGSVTVSFAKNGDMIETKIKDTGAGINPDDLPKLFQKFGMLESSYAMNKSASGTGLGLYICRAIIELHKGKIRVASEGHSKGAEFTFTLKTTG